MSAQATTTLKADRIIDGTGSPAIENATLQIDGSHVSSVKQTSSDGKGNDSAVLDFAGCTILPGLMDMHGHISFYNADDTPTLDKEKVAYFHRSDEYRLLYAAERLRNNLAMGVTTVRDLAGLPVRAMVALRDAEADGRILGARLSVSAVASTTNSHLHPIIQLADTGDEMVVADGPWELRKLVRQHFLHGADSIKLALDGGPAASKAFNEPMYRRAYTQEEVDAIVDEAHAYNKQVTCHVVDINSARMAIKAGADSIEHGVNLDDECVEKMAAQGMTLVPTLRVYMTSLEQHQRSGTPKWALEKWDDIRPKAFASFQRAVAAGVTIACGTDSAFSVGDGRSGEEIELYVQNGLSEIEAIKAATANAAALIGRSHDLGTLEPGKLADLIVVRGNPAQDIKVLQSPENIVLVIKDGKIVVDRRSQGDHVMYGTPTLL